MKKIFLFILLLMPMIVFADENPLSVYNATVKNKNGIKYTYTNYETKQKITNKIAYGTNITVSVFKLEWTKETYINTTYNDRIIEIKLNDVTLDKNNFELKNADSYDYKIEDLNNYKIKIFNKDGVKLKTGPAKDYNTLEETIPYNTTLDVIKYIGTEDIDGDIYYWMYVNYNGVYGWLDVYHKNYIYFENDNVYMTTSKTDIKLDNKVIGSIPANTVINPNYYNSNSKTYYISYEGKAGFIDGSSLAYRYNTSVRFKYEHKIYAEADKKSRVIANIPAGVSANSYYYYSNDDENANKYLGCYFISYEGKKGWACLDKGENLDYGSYLYRTTTRTIQAKETNNNASSTLIFVLVTCGSCLVAGITAAVIIFVNNSEDKEKKIEEQSLIEEDLD